MLWKIAIRNIMRHKRRTIFSGITIMFGMVFFIMMDSMLTGMDRGALDNLIDLSTASLKICTRQYMEEMEAMPLRHGIANGDEVKRKLSRFDRVRGVTPRTRFLGQLSIYTETMPVSGVVIDPFTDTTVFDLDGCIEGSYFSGSSRREIVLGKRLARDLDLKAGDWVTLYSLTRYESHNADDFLIVGLLNSTDPSINSSTVYITYTAADDFLDLDGLVTELDVGLHRRTNLPDMKKDAELIAAGLTPEFPELRIQTFMEMASGFLEIAKTKRAFGFVYLFVIMLIACIGIFNSVLMSVYERIREVGVMRALGFTPGELTSLFLLEGFITGIFGALLGVAGGVAVNIGLVYHGYPVDKIFGYDDIGDFPLWGTMYGEWNIPTFIIVFVFCVATATLAGLIPARKAGKMEITRALRFV